MNEWNILTILVSKLTCSTSMLKLLEEDEHDPIDNSYGPFSLASLLSVVTDSIFRCRMDGVILHCTYKKVQTHRRSYRHWMQAASAYLPSLTLLLSSSASQPLVHWPAFSSKIRQLCSCLRASVSSLLSGLLLPSLCLANPSPWSFWRKKYPFLRAAPCAPFLFFLPCSPSTLHEMFIPVIGYLISSTTGGTIFIIFTILAWHMVVA